ncbi:MAG: circadian clock KaiB family protein, partial [Candidatus Competibacter sp.]|nr:circadian clock KaiB family protein [Candidatus Competibacter sp.]
MTGLPAETETTPAESTRGNYALRLYVAGDTPQSRLAIERAKALCETHLKGCHELTIVDLYQQPEVLQDEQIVAVPLLVKKSPPPVRQFIGDLWDTNRILLGLDLYRVLVERINEGAAVVSAQNVVLYCNRRFAELFKIPLDRVAGLDMASFIAPSARATLYALLDAGRAGRGSGEITGWTADGAAVPLLLTCNALPVGSDKEVSIVVTDLSERKR